jgi:uncharacterized Tic20 family protein
MVIVHIYKYVSLQEGTINYQLSTIIIIITDIVIVIIIIIILIIVIIIIISRFD